MVTGREELERLRCALWRLEQALALYVLAARLEQVRVRSLEIVQPRQTDHANITDAPVEVCLGGQLHLAVHLEHLSAPASASVAGGGDAGTAAAAAAGGHRY